MTIASKQSIFFAAMFVMFALVFSPYQAHAVGLEGDILCGKQYCYPGNCKQNPKDPKCIPCPTVTCPDNTNGFKTPAKCVSSKPGKCQATGAAGGDKFGTDILKQMLGSLMQKLMQGGQGSGSGSGSGSGGNPINTTQPTCSLTSTTDSTDASSTVATLSWTSSYDVTSATISPDIGSVSPNG
ncbi:MAG: hypothetical protein AAB927_00345, partial [Patescibacteria group bacterium]